MEITKDKVTEIFCIADDFCKEFDKEIEKMAIRGNAKILWLMRLVIPTTRYKKDLKKFAKKRKWASL